jgi:hypothetical protein
LGLIEPVSQLTNGSARPAALARPIAIAGAVAEARATPAILLAMPHHTGELPFLAQYVAQEIFGTDRPASRWRDRDNAYRLAGTRTVAAQLNISI